MKGMISTMKSLVCVIAIGLTWTSGLYAVPASFDDSMPSTTTQFFGNQVSGFSVIGNVSYDPNSGPWIKQFVNDGGGGGGGGIASGRLVLITETFTNTGTVTWTDWHEEILSTTDIGNPNLVPGFLFKGPFLVVEKNSSPLTQGTDYTLQTVDHFGGYTLGGGGPSWSAMSIFFEPGSLIAPGDTLTIQKQIYEVFSDGNIWQNGEFAEVQQYPTVPEPSSIVLLAAGMTLLLLGRRRSAKTLAR